MLLQAGGRRRISFRGKVVCRRSLGGEAATALHRKFARKTVKKLKMGTIAAVSVVGVVGVVGVGVGVCSSAMAAMD